MGHNITIHQKILLVAGPTASGKSRLACDIAKAIGGEIVCCDALQSYKDWRILTARPSPREESYVPHHLYGFVTKEENFFSVGKWQNYARNTVKDIFSRGKIPILVGGTGLYFRCFLEGLPPFPSIPQSIKIALRKRLKSEGSNILYRKLTQCDPIIATHISPQDGNRIIRALEVYQASGIPMSLWQERSPLDVFQKPFTGLFLQATRKQLCSAITKRFLLMMETGVMKEVRKVISYQLNADHPLLKAYGASSLIAYEQGDISFQEAYEKTISQTLQYVRRQNTWAKHYMKHWEWVPYQTSREHIIKNLDERLSKSS